MFSADLARNALVKYYGSYLLIINLYCRIDHEGSIKIESGGRPIPGYSMNITGDKIPDELIKEFIISLIETEALLTTIGNSQYALKEDIT